MNAIQTHFWAVRDYLAPVLRESKFKEHGRITPDEFVAAGDFLAYKFPTWSWSSGDASKTRDFLPKDKQYLVSKGVPCLRRVSQMERAALGTKRKGAASSSTAQTDERLLSFAEGKDGIDVTGAGGEDDWLATHLDDEGQGASNAEVGEIEDMPDAPPEADSLTAGQEDDLASRIAGTSLGDDDDDGDDGGEVGDIPDMDDEDEEAMAGAGVVEHEDPSALAPPPKAAPTTSAGGSNILSVRTYDCLISYDKYYQTPRMWLVGYDEHGSPLKPAQIFEDISSDYAQKTVTIEPFPHSATLNTASVHPCKHASVMRKVIERMDASVKEEQKRLRTKQQQGGEGEEASVDDAAAPTSSTKKKKWGLGGAMKKVANRSASSAAVATSDSTDSPGDATPNLVEVEGLRVDQYLLVFLKFMASIVPAIEIDATQSF